MKFTLPWSYWLKKQRKDKPPRPILATEVTYEEELIVEVALRVVMKNAPEGEDVGDLLSLLAKENFRLNGWSKEERNRFELHMVNVYKKEDASLAP